MKNKKILAVEIEAPRGNDMAAVAKIVDINGEKHLITDVYVDGEKLIRYALTENRYCKYLAYDSWKPTTRRETYEVRVRDGEYESVLRYAKLDDSAKQAFKEFGITKKELTLRDLWYKFDTIAMEQSANVNSRKEAEMAEYMDALPEIPEDFEGYIKQMMNVNNIITYKRITKAKSEYECLKCGKKWEARNDTSNEDMFDGRLYMAVPVKGEECTCPMCSNTGTLKQSGRQTQTDYKINNFYLYQNTENGDLVVRYFEVWRYQRKGQAESWNINELSRTFMHPGKLRKYYNVAASYREVWDYRNAGGYYSITEKDGYEYWMNNLTLRKSSMKYCNIEEIMKHTACSKRNQKSRLEVLSAYAAYPGIEILANMGFSAIVRELIWWRGRCGMLRKKQKKVADILNIYPERVQLLREKGGEHKLWNLLQWERRTGQRLTAEQMEDFKDFYADDIKSLEVIMKYMSLTKAWNRIKQYEELQGHYCNMYGVSGYRITLIKYRDYLQIREELGYDMTNSVYLHPADLESTHQQMVEERSRRRDEKYINEMMAKYNKIPKKYKNLVTKYGWNNSIFVFRPLMSAEEIIMEGRIQHHCVGGENYLRKHNEGESAIFVMRYKDKPDVPYVTIEVKNGKIVQWYNAHDKKTDDPDTLCTIKNWEKLIAKRFERKAA